MSLSNIWILSQISPISFQFFQFFTQIGIIQVKAQKNVKMGHPNVLQKVVERSSVTTCTKYHITHKMCKS